ncbi:MAG: hypothetical protein ACPGWR_00990 [Ardenticatenaceae bacterium]
MISDKERELLESASFIREWRVFVVPLREKVKTALIKQGVAVYDVSGEVEITEKVTKTPIINEWIEENIYDWNAQLEGVHYNSMTMPVDCGVLIKSRAYQTKDAFYPDWSVVATGYIRLWNVEGDKDKKRSWTATVQSVRTYMDEYPVDAQQHGRRDLAEGASASASGSLANAELESSEFGGGLGEIDPSNLTDRNLSTVWISDIAAG